MNEYRALAVACEIELEEISRANTGHITRLDGKITRTVAIALGERGGTIYHKTALNCYAQPMPAIVSGPCDITLPDHFDFALPVRFGRQIVFIRFDNAGDWTTNLPEVTS